LAKFLWAHASEQLGEDDRWDDESRLFVFRIMSPIVDWNQMRRPVRTGDLAYISTVFQPIYYHAVDGGCKMIGCPLHYCFMDDPIHTPEEAVINHSLFRLQNYDSFTNLANGQMLPDNGPVLAQLLSEGHYFHTIEFGASAHRCMRMEPEVYKNGNDTWSYAGMLDIPMSFMDDVSECFLYLRVVPEEELFPQRTEYHFS